MLSSSTITSNKPHQTTKAKKRRMTGHSDMWFCSLCQVCSSPGPSHMPRGKLPTKSRNEPTSKWSTMNCLARKPLCSKARERSLESLPFWWTQCHPTQLTLLRSLSTRMILRNFMRDKNLKQVKRKARSQRSRSLFPIGPCIIWPIPWETLNATTMSSIMTLTWTIWSKKSWRRTRPSGCIQDLPPRTLSSKTQSS